MTCETEIDKKIKTLEQEKLDFQMKNGIEYNLRFENTYWKYEKYCSETIGYYKVLSVDWESAKCLRVMFYETSNNSYDANTIEVSFNKHDLKDNYCDGNKIREDDDFGYRFSKISKETFEEHLNKALKEINKELEVKQ